MALVQIPVELTAPDFVFQVELDAVVYGFHLILNERTGRWSVEIQTSQGEEIVSGLALVSNWKILERFKDARLPPGRLFTCDMTGGNSEPDELNLGDTVLICYDEVAA